MDYIAKPFDHDELVEAVRRILADSQAVPNVADEDVGEQDYPVSGIIGSCDAMQLLFRKISKVALHRRHSIDSRRIWHRAKNWLSPELCTHKANAAAPP